MTFIFRLLLTPVFLLGALSGCIKRSRGWKWLAYEVSRAFRYGVGD